MKQLRKKELKQRVILQTFCDKKADRYQVRMITLPSTKENNTFSDESLQITETTIVPKEKGNKYYCATYFQDLYDGDFTKVHCEDSKIEISVIENFSNFVGNYSSDHQQFKSSIDQNTKFISINIESGEYEVENNLIRVSTSENENILKKSGVINAFNHQSDNNYNIHIIICNIPVIIVADKSITNDKVIEYFFNDTWDKFEFVSYNDNVIECFFDEESKQSAKYNEISIKEKVESIYASSSLPRETVKFKNFGPFPYVSKYSNTITGIKLVAGYNGSYSDIYYKDKKIKYNLCSLSTLIDIALKTKENKREGNNLSYKDEDRNTVLRDILMTSNCGPNEFTWNLYDENDKCIRVIKYNTDNNIVSYEDISGIKYELKYKRYGTEHNIVYYQDNDFSYFEPEPTSFTFGSHYLLWSDTPLMRNNPFGIPMESQY